MTSASSFSVRLPLLVAGAALLTGLTGCTLSSGVHSTAATQGVALTGSIMGGRQPIAGSKIYMFATGTTGYGSAGTSLLSGAGTATDSTGSYVLSDSNGNFSITADYLCTAGAQVYLYASGGTASPGDGNNTSVGLLAGLGQCPSSGTFLASVPNVVINEVTTIATAYSLAGFAVDPTHIGSPNTSMATTGIANAMGNVANVVDVTRGQALLQPASTIASSGNNANAMAPYNKINALADILAACINGATNNGNCQTLFNNVTSNGSTTTGNNPTDTATAAIYMAKNQWHAPAALMTLVSSSSPFTTTLTSMSDLSLAVTYFGQGSGGAGLMADANGFIWASVNGNNSLTKFSPQGVYGTPSTMKNSSGNGEGPQELAIDSTGNVWVPLANSNTNGGQGIAVFANATNTQLSNSPYYPTNSSSTLVLGNPYGLAFDATGNAYVSNKTSGTVVELSGSGAYIQTLSTTTPSANGAAVARNGDLWVGATSTATSLYYFPNIPTTGGQTPVTLTGCVTTAGGQTGQGLAVDYSNNAWFSCNTGVAKITPPSLTVAYYGQGTNGASHGGGTIAIDSAGNVFQACGTSGGCVNEFNSSGAMLTPAAGYNITPSLSSGTASNQLYVTIDISGNVWTTGANRVYQLLGVAAPTAGPISPNNIQAAP